MNQIINSFISATNEIGGGFCNFAGNMLIQSSVLILLLLIFDFLIKKRVRATFRYWIWMLVFIKLILPPTLSLPTGVGNWLGEYFTTNSIVAEQQFDIEYNEPVIISSTQQPTRPVEKPPVQVAPALSESITSVSSDIPVISAGTALNTLTWQGIVFMLWLVGVLVIAVLLIQRVFFVRGLIAQSEPAKNRLAHTLDNCREKVGIRRDIQLKLSHNVTSPAVCGLFRPVILVPKAIIEKLSQDKLKAVLTHELAHIKRGDLWINCAQTLLQIAYFYNPFVWLANTMVRRIREQAVDEMVLVALGTQADSYSNTLIDIAEMAFSRPALSLRLVGVVESKKALSRRIKHILSRPLPKSAKLGIAGLLVITVTASVLLPMAKADKKPIEQVDRIQHSDKADVQPVQHSYAAKMDKQDKAKIILRANVFSVNGPISIITDYLRDELGVNNTASEMTDAQVIKFKKWMETVPETTMMSSPSLLVFDGKTAEMSVITNEKFYTADYEKTSDSPPQYKPVLKNFTTGVEFEFTPALTKDKSIIHLSMKFDKTDLVKVEEKKHESGNTIQLPVLTNSEIVTQVAVPVGKYFLVSAAGTQQAKQIVLLVKANVQNEAGPSDNKTPAGMVGTWFFDNPMGDEEQMAIFPDGRVVVLYSNGHKDQSYYENGFIELAEYNNARFKIAMLENGTLIQYVDTDTGGLAKRWRRIDSQPQSKLLRTLTGEDNNKTDVRTEMSLERLDDPETDSIIKEMKTITNTMVQAFNAGNVDKLLSYYTDDGIRLPDQVKAAIGKDALRELQMRELKENVKIQSFKELDKNVYVCGDYVFETGKVVISLSKPNTRFLLSDWLNYITIWSRQPDSSLKIKLDAISPAVIPEGDNIPEADGFVMVKVKSDSEPSEDMNAVYEKIKKFENEFHHKFIERDSEGAAGFYADDTILMPWRQNAVKGKKEITEFIKKDIAKSPLVDMTVDVAHIEGNNKVVYAANILRILRPARMLLSQVRVSMCGRARRMAHGKSCST